MSGREAKKTEEHDSLTDRFTTKARLNLNDLLRKRSDEKQVEKKTNRIIFLSASAIGVVLLLILNL